MTGDQKKAYEWAKNQNYYSMAARYAKELARLVDELQAEFLNQQVFAPPHTNSDRINAMTIEEKAEFLSSIAYGRETPWCEQFAEKFCKSCPTTTCTVEGYHHPMDLHECDFTDGKCPHGEDIVWWLQQPAEGDGNA